MATSPSSTSSSSGLLRQALIAAALIAAAEVYLHFTMAPLEAANRALAAGVARVDPAIPNHHALGLEPPERFFERMRAALADRPIVFVGDSQGAGARGSGLTFSQAAALRLAAEGASTPVLNLHLGGANTFEQGMLLLAMTQAGIRPRAVFWSHSIFSLRKNEIRAEFASAWRSVRWDAIGGAPEVILPQLPAAEAGRPGPVARFKRGVAAGWGRLLDRSATIRFSRRSLYDKWTLLLRSPLARLMPGAAKPATARTEDPPTSVLLEAAAFAGRVTGVLEREGVRTIDYLSPINGQATPRPFSARAEAVAYPALFRAVAANGSTLVNYVNLLPADDFGRFADGTADAFHIDVTGHQVLADSLLARLGGDAR